MPVTARRHPDQALEQSAISSLSDTILPLIEGFDQRLQAGIEVLDAGLCMNTHRHLSGLPGLAIPKTMGAFPSRDNIIRYLGDYAAQLDVPIDHGEFNFGC